MYLFLKQADNRVTQKLKFISFLNQADNQVTQKLKYYSLVF